MWLSCCFPLNSLFLLLIPLPLFLTLFSLSYFFLSVFSVYHSPISLCVITFKAHALSLSLCPSLCLTASVLYRVRLNGQVSAWPTRTTTCHHRLAGLTRSWSAIASNPTTTGGASSPTTRTSSSGQPHLTPRSSCLPRPRRCTPFPQTH